MIESRLDRGRGPVATVLVQKGTLQQGDIVVAGAEWGRVRAMLDDKGKPMPEAGPSTPVEILGLSGAPSAGEPFVVVENESRAREITEFRQRRKLRDKAAGVDGRRARHAGPDAGPHPGRRAEGSRGADQGRRARQRRGDPGHGAEAGARGSEGPRAACRRSARSPKATCSSPRRRTPCLAFNVRATSQARELAQRDGVDIRYFSIIYEVSDDIEKLVQGKVAPKAREKFLGYAEVRKVFNITKTGKVAGCMITEGLVKRGAGVRVLRDNVVIHNGELSQLKRFKDDVREVARGYECGLSFANFHDLQEGDVVECFETEMVPG